MDFKCLVLIIALTTIEIEITESRQSSKRRWKTDDHPYSHYANICDIQDRVSKVHCYCESIKIQTATKADCWVFNGGIAEDDPFWSNFYSQPKIERLIFNVRADGGLTYIPSKVIVRLDRLQYFNIQRANIYNIPSFAFTNSTTLREITLTKNNITKLEKLSFAHLIMLSNVSLVDNQISELKRDVFYVLPNLQRLYLSKNLISVLHDGCFKDLNNLKRLDLDSNLLNVVIRENFLGMSNLISLGLRNNKLTMVGDLAFAELWSLQELNLDGNEIEYISERGFGGLTQLRKLSLNGNKLETLSGGVLYENLKLNLFDLRNNNLETLKQETVQNVLENMKSPYALISLEGNKLSCDCRLMWIYKLREETKSKKIKSSLDKLSCVTENSFPKIESVKNNTKKNTKPKNNYIKHIYGSDEEFDDDSIYDDAMQDQEINLDELKGFTRNRLLDIPKNSLPCPRKLIGYSVSPPTQDEVKYYKTSSSHKCIVNFYYILLFTALVKLF